MALMNAVECASNENVIIHNLSIIEDCLKNLHCQTSLAYHEVMPGEEQPPKPIPAADQIANMREKQRKLGPLKIPTDEELARKERESAERVVKHFAELGMPGHVNEFGEAVFSAESQQEAPSVNPPAEKPTQLSFGKFDATQDPERGIQDMHETFGNIQRSDNPFANPKHTKEIKKERKRNKRIYGRRKTKGDVLKRLNSAK